ncbi:MAG: pitrilysin family protein [Rhodothermales bacterium]
METIEAATDAHPFFDIEEMVAGITALRHKSNGLQVLLLPEAAAPVATVMITYRVGSRNEALGHTGATHFLEHMMFKGTERFHKKHGTSIFNTLQRVGAQVNATTWLDRTNYYELLPSEHLDLALQIEADRMRGVLLDPDDMASERTVILNEFDRGENEPLQALYHAVWASAYQAHPYHHPTIGWRSDIETVTPEGLRHFYDTYYWPNNATLSVIGQFEPEAALGAIHKYFGRIPAAPEPWPEVTTQEPPQQGERRLTIRRAGQLGSLMIAFKSPNAFSTDTDALDVLTTILTEGKSSRLYRSLTAQGKVAALFGDASRLRDPGLVFVFAMLTPGTTHDEVEQIILDELQRLATDGPTEAEVARAKNGLKAEEAFARDGSYQIASQLNEAIAAGDWRLYATYRERIDQVTPADVQRAAATYCIEDARTIGRFIPNVN